MQPIPTEPSRLSKAARLEMIDLVPASSDVCEQHWAAPSEHEPTVFWRLERLAAETVMAEKAASAAMRRNCQRRENQSQMHSERVDGGGRKNSPAF
jgi:hypothetical protein